MSKPSEKLKALDIALPTPPAVAGSYAPVVQSGSILYVSGNLPVKNGVLIHPGTVGDTVDIGAANEAARLCAINILANAAGYLGSVDKIKRIIKVTGFVASAFGFSDQPKVVDGASDFFVAVFGDDGRHARSAVGVSALPRGACVEVEAVIEI
ncbi:MAG: RidA family protein [Actinomycetota bacterium]|jgi:enamine deaminase RidA (YjgF/YER057c/UK114 family)|nr:RidA family protein [Actinomycetota bacterium]